MAASLPLSSRGFAARAGFHGHRLTVPSNGARALMFAREGNWLPGSEKADWLPEGIPGNFGYDPLGLAKEPDSLIRLQEGELLNARWAMLGSAGMIAPELLGQGNWIDAANWAVEGGKPSFFGTEIPFGLGTLLVIEFLFFLGIETARMPPPLGYAPENEPEKRLYPGVWDPANFSEDPEEYEDYKIKELNNGRLGMLGFLGMVAQYYATGKGPLENVSDHIADPFGNNILSNLG